MVLPKKAAPKARPANPVRPVITPFRKKAPPRGVPKVQRKPQAQQRRRGIPNYLDPMTDTPMPQVTSDGKALPHTALVSDDFTVDTSNYTVLFVTNTGHSGTVGTSFKVDSDGAYVTGTTATFVIPTMSSSAAEGGPSAGRAMKFSVSIVNSTNAMKRAGRVTYLNSSQRLPPRSDDAADRYMNIISGVKSSPYRRRVNGDTFSIPSGQSAKHLIGFPIDQTEYATFKPFVGTETGDEFLSHVLGADATNVAAARPMSVVAYIFDPTSDVQEYSVTIRASYFTRWPLTSVPGQHMRNIPTSPVSIINHVRDAAEDHGHELQNVVEGGLIATIGPKVGKALLTRAIGGMEAGGAAIGGAATEAGSASALMPLLAAL